MTPTDVLNLFKSKIPSNYQDHMLCYFSDNARHGFVLPFLDDLICALSEIDSAAPGYASEMIDRMASIHGIGEDKYEMLLQILSEIYVTQGVVEAADRVGNIPQVNHEPGLAGKKNPECEALFGGSWCAIEVKTPKLIDFSRIRTECEFQLTARLPAGFPHGNAVTLPRDNPVKDFLISANEKFKVYESFRPGSLRILFIIWDDYCHEPISALTNPISGLLTSSSFHRDSSGLAVEYSHVDGVIIIRHQHQIRHSTRDEPFIDGVKHAMHYHHAGFPLKAFIPVPGGRNIPDGVLDSLNAVPLEGCMGAEYQPIELIMWIGGDSHVSAPDPTQPPPPPTGTK